jgi:hypothetical protein
VRRMKTMPRIVVFLGKKRRVQFPFHNRTWGDSGEYEFKVPELKAGLGRIISDKTRAKLRAYYAIDDHRENSAKLQHGAQACIPVEQLTLDGTFIASYRSMKHADVETGVPHGNISKVLRGIYGSAGGFMWRHVK